MTRDHFSKQMQSPNFAQSYEKTPGAKMEKEIENFFKKLKKRLKFWKE